jgi:hypothetical protein
MGPNLKIYTIHLAAYLGLGLMLLLTGCVSEGGKPPKKTVSAPVNTGGIQEINVLAMPMALNFDAKPGPDGFIIKIYASNPKRPKPLFIEEGKVEIYMFDGVPGMTADATGEPRRIWAYTAAELIQFEIKSSIGPAYQFALLWGEAKPRGDRITVGVRYTPPSGRSIDSAPSVISVATQ